MVQHMNDIDIQQAEAEDAADRLTVWEVWRDDTLITQCETHSEAFGEILRRQGNSVSYAKQYGGWKIKEVTG